MWPWAHAAVGYLLYATYAYRRGLPLRGLPVVAAVIATQGPDLLDKPLAWTFAILPTGRSLGHSLFFAALLAAVGWYALARRFGRPNIAVGAAVGYLSHLPADGLGAILAGRWADLSYLAWPLLPLPEYDLAPQLRRTLRRLRAQHPHTGRVRAHCAGCPCLAAGRAPGPASEGW